MKSKPESVANHRPFATPVLAKAQRAVDDYRFSFWREDGRFIAECVELDTLGVGKTSAAALAEARGLAITAAAVLIESRKRLPLPAAAQARTVQVNIRLSPAEKRAVEEAARSGGFRGISDFLRIRGLSVG